LLLVAEDEIHAGEPCHRVRIRLGVATRHDQHGFGVLAGDPPDDLPVGEVGPPGHRAGVHHVDLGGLLAGDGAETVALEQPHQLLGLDLVEPAPQGREGDGDRRHHATTASLNWPQAAPMSSPLLQRTVAVIPCSSSTLWKARMRVSGGRANGAPCQSLNGIRLTFARMPLSRRPSLRASCRVSLTPSSSTYSKVMRWRNGSGKRRQAASNGSMAKPLFTGMRRSRVSLVVAWSEIARLTRRFSRASFSMPPTSPTVDTVIRRGEEPKAPGSVGSRSD